MSTATPLPPPDRYCDIVMKGGITSGVVYPRAIRELSRHYVFKNIGGTSAGALAAVVTAAAEYRRRSSQSMAGFELLEQLPEELGARLPDSRQRRLLSLFQPEPQTRRLFNVLVYSLNRETLSGRAAAILLAFLRAYWPATLLSLALAALLGWRFGWLAALLSGLFALLAAIGLWVYRDLSRHVVANDYGICTGMTAAGSRSEALTPWLHNLVQRAAGRGPADPPLTFGELWSAPGFPPEYLQALVGGRCRSINLEMFTTNLSHGRPYIIPFEDPTARLYYRPEELSRYVPAPVMDWILAHSRPYAPRAGHEHEDPRPEKAAGLLELPAPADFPIVLAARMSLSFPLLFCAIPLWAIDYEPPPGRRGFSRCLFSDGGLCSNFPMHLFDGLIPMWPTFGLELEPELKFWRDPVFLPRRYSQGYGERADRFDEALRLHPESWGEGGTAPAQASGALRGFASAVLNVMQNWNDTSLSRMPGVRDRIVRIRLNAREGGLNLNMTEERIQALANRGLAAAQKLVERYVPPAAGGSAPGWDEQRWVRLVVFLRMLERRLPAVRTAALLEGGHVRSYEEMIEQATCSAPAGMGQCLSDADAAALKGLLQCLVGFSAEFAARQGGYSFEPVPEPELRVRPQL